MHLLRLEAEAGIFLCIGRTQKNKILRKSVKLLKFHW